MNLTVRLSKNAANGKIVLDIIWASIYVLVLVLEHKCGNTMLHPALSAFFWLASLVPPYFYCELLMPFISNWQAHGYENNGCPSSSFTGSRHGYLLTSTANYECSLYQTGKLMATKTMGVLVLLLLARVMGTSLLLLRITNALYIKLASSWLRKQWVS